MKRSDFILVSSSESESVADSESLTDSDSDILVGGNGGSDVSFRFVKRFTKRDLRILYLPVWFIRQGGMELCRTCLIKYEDRDETDTIVCVNQRKPPREAMFELHKQWERFTRANRIKAGKKYVVEFIPRTRQRLEYLNVSHL